MKLTQWIIAGGSIAFVLYGYGGYRYWKLHQENGALQNQVAGLTQDLASTTSALAGTQTQNAILNQALQAEQGKNVQFEAKINEISTIVGVLQKLSSTDPELLKKYSKIYFLNENYVPAQLSSIDSQYLYDKNRSQLFLTGALPKLTAMLQAANADGITLQIVSAYRSFYDQAAVKEGYKVIYGAGANQFSAEQGYSEHQLGTAADFTSPGVKAILSGFEISPAYAWLNANAYKFGFILSYPQGNSYYQFEPWHWRFVGVALATNLHDTNRHFYDVDQREIDGYLITLFN